MQYLLRSGNIFVYADVSTGPGHWDDGKNWAFIRWEDGLRVEREHDRPDTLRKKSGTIVHQDVSHYFVSYYKIKDPLNSTLKRPSQSSKRASLL